MTAFFLAAVAMPLWQMSESDLDHYLKEAASKNAPFSQRLAEVVHDSVGMPYADGPLGEGPDGRYDKDPLMDPHRVDCVTFVEQSVALAASSSYQDAFALLQRIRYQDGKIDYETRNHFMISDWLAHNAWCRDVSRDLGVSPTLLTRTISRRGFFQRVKAPELGKRTADQDVTIHYIPTASASAAETQLPSPALIVFIGQKPTWLFALHTGIYLRDADGTGHLYHASSAASHVIAASLPEYIESQKTRYLGFTAYAIQSPEGK